MIIFDTETTGLPKPMAVGLEFQPKIIEFAAIKIDDETLEEVEIIEFLANPDQVLDKFIINFTGITNEAISKAQPFKFYYSQLFEFFKGEKTIIAHNLSFDLSLLNFELQRLEKSNDFPIPLNKICTVNQTYNLFQYRLSMAKLYEYLFGEPIKEAHRALIDCENLVKIVKELIKRDLIKI